MTFHRKPLPGGRGQAIKSPEVSAMENLSEILIKKTGIHRKSIDRILQILFQIENKTFSKNSFSNTHNIPLRTLTRYITILKNHRLISFEGSKRKGQYNITKTYKSLKELSKTKVNN